LTGGVVVQGAGAVGGEFVDESSAGVIGPGSAAGGAVGLDQLAGVVVGIDGVPIGAIDLVNATVKIPADAGDRNARGVGHGMQNDIAVMILPGLDLIPGARLDNASGGIICNVNVAQGGVGDAGDAPEHVSVVFDAGTIGVDHCGAGAVGVIFPAGGLRGCGAGGDTFD